MARTTIATAAILMASLAIPITQHATVLASDDVAHAATKTGSATDDREATDLSAREILDRVDDMFRGTSSVGEAEMTIATEHWTRTLSLAFWTHGKEKSLFRILSPKKEKGTATLKVDADLWNYLPKVNRVIKLPSSMMSASWMGSHFSNDDLVKESRMAEDYDFEISFNGLRDEVELIEITCIPKENAAVVWGKVEVTVQRKTYLPISVVYYDEDLTLVRTMTYSDVRELGGRMLPATITIVPREKPQESTRVSYATMDFDIAHGDDLFSLRSLQE